MTPPGIVDAHVHFMPQVFLEAASAEPDHFSADVRETDDSVFELRPRGWAMSLPSSTPRYTFGPLHHDWPTRLEWMDAHGHGTHVVSGLQSLFYDWADPGLAAEVAQLVNDDLAAASTAHPGRVLGLATLPLHNVEAAVDELERAVSELGLSGAQILTRVAAHELDDPSLDPLFAHAEHLGVPLFIHPFGSFNEQRLSKHALFNSVGFPTDLAVAGASLILGGVFDRHPELAVVLSHGGGSLSFLIGRIERGYELMRDSGVPRLERTPREYLENVVVDTVTHDDDVLRFVIDRLGAERVLLGSDWPMSMQDASMLDRLARVVDPSTPAWEAITVGTARRLFGA